MKIFILFLGLAAGILIIGIGYTLTIPEPIQVVGNHQGIFDLKFTDVTDGKEVRLADLKGIPIVLNIWVSWNSYCENELVDFVRLQKEFGDKVKIIAINNGERVELVNAFLASHPGTTDLGVWLDENRSLYKKISAKDVPYTIFIDKNGEVVKDHSGHITYDQIKHTLISMTFERSEESSPVLN